MRSTLSVSLLALCAYGASDTPPVAPQTELMEPRVGKPGTVIKLTGKSLDQTHVDEVYLTDHRFDMKVKVLEQSANKLVFRIPPFVKPGRLQLLLLTAGKSPVYLEQPWFLLIEAGDEETAPPAEISRIQSKLTVEVAATGTRIPVPMAGAAPPLSTGAALEKTVVPLKARPLTPTPVAVEAPGQRQEPAPQEKPVEMASATLPPVQSAQQARIIPSESRSPSEPLASSDSRAPVRGPQEQPIATPSVPGNQAAPNPANIPAQVVRRSKVSYPTGAAAQRIEGAVQLVAIIRPDGRVKEVKVLKGNPLLVSAAVSSVREWLYEPAYLHGKPVESEVAIVLNFKRSE